MDSPIAADMLQRLPALLYIWSLFILGWGTIAGSLFYNISKRVRTCIAPSVVTNERYALWLIAGVNIFLMWYLVAYANTKVCASWIVVINVFYTGHLLHATVDAARWWKALNQRCTGSKISSTT